MNKNRFISILLLLSFSVVMAHSMIPHHHHSDFVFSAKQDACHAEHQGQKGDDHIPDACHAFNTLSFFKESYVQEIQALEIPIFYYLYSVDRINADFEEVILNLYYPDSVPIVTSYIANQNISRGPPSL